MSITSQTNRAKRHIRPGANKGGRPRKGNVPFKLCIQPSTLAAVGKAAFAANLDRNVWIEHVLIGELARLSTDAKGGSK